MDLLGTHVPEVQVEFRTSTPQTPKLSRPVILNAEPMNEPA